MSSSANVHSIQALEEFRSALQRFKSEAQAPLNAVEGEINRVRVWLQERLQYWQNELRRRRRILEEAQSALRACEAMAVAAAVASGGRAAPDCSPLQAAVIRAKQRVQEAEQELRTVQEYIKRVEDAVASYQHQARQFVAVLDNDLLKGSELLNKSVAILLSYVSGSLGTSVGSGLDASSVSSSVGRPLMEGEGGGTETTQAPLDPVYITCSHCGGSGNEEVECNPCGGTGRRFDGSQCPHCRGLGVQAITCWRCQGKGSILKA
ncbi:MAG TPA: hypothetical protein VFA10_16975 [Ktedonobacteraceae bacterium]|nr:hypothetical protein [Ktedonobacteraceae bacterium]